MTDRLTPIGFLPLLAPPLLQGRCARAVGKPVPHWTSTTTLVRSPSDHA